MVKVEEDLVILRSMVMEEPNRPGLNASPPVFHRDTAATACEQPVLMNCSALVARPVSRALTPRQHCRACRLALLPLPLLPEMKLTCGLQHSIQGSVGGEEVYVVSMTVECTVAD